MSDEEKSEILEGELDMDELEAVSGGFIHRGNKKQRTPHVGGCTKDFFSRPCSATVEEGSVCRTDDKCTFSSEFYEPL